MKLRGATRLKTGPFRGLGSTELGEGAGYYEKQDAAERERLKKLEGGTR
ncbi:hypothetical protein [Amycolatopsis plumensis]|uniref:Uncharacterized protein n=1 Tax=Amycolatopsis plumensis TaxID=236508 RepID=A0ABV5U7Y5_9PSEU